MTRHLKLEGESLRGKEQLIAGRKLSVSSEQPTFVHTWLDREAEASASPLQQQENHFLDRNAHYVPQVNRRIQRPGQNHSL